MAGCLVGVCRCGIFFLSTLPFKLPYGFSRRKSLIGTYSGKLPSTRHIYCFCTWRLRIWCSIWRAFFGLRPNSNRPDVKRSRRCIVRKFFKLNSLARIKTTVLWRYLPHGWTWKMRFQAIYIYIKMEYKKRNGEKEKQNWNGKKWTSKKSSTGNIRLEKFCGRILFFFARRCCCYCCNTNACDCIAPRIDEEMCFWMEKYMKNTYKKLQRNKGVTNRIPSSFLSIQYVVDFNFLSFDLMR